MSLQPTRATTLLARASAGAAVVAVVITAACGERPSGLGRSPGGADPQSAVTRSSTAVAVTPAATPTIADDFPLADGWPEDDDAEPGGGNGLQGPGRTLPALRLPACGRAVPEPAYTDRISARWTNVEDHRARQLTTFADADEAAAHVADLVELHRGCPAEEVDPDGYRSIIEVRPVDAATEAWAVVRRYERDGAPAVGLQVTLLVREGPAVLADSAANEAGAGPDPAAEVRRHVEQQLHSAEGVVAAMCPYSRAGCA